MPQLWSQSVKNWRNSLYFQHILDIKQPYVMTEPKEIGCVIENG